MKWRQFLNALGGALALQPGEAQQRGNDHE